MKEKIQKIMSVLENPGSDIAQQSKHVLNAAVADLQKALNNYSSDEQLKKDTDVIIVGGIILALAVHGSKYLDNTYPLSASEVLAGLKIKTPTLTDKIKHVGEKALLSSEIPLSLKIHTNLIKNLHKVIKNDYFSAYNLISEEDFILIAEKRKEQKAQEKQLKVEADARLFDPVLKTLLELTSEYQPNSTELLEPYQNLVTELNFKYSTSEKRVTDFYKKIAENNFELLENIKKDTSIPAERLIAGIAIIAATILTGILPGLLIMLIVNLATGKHVGNLFEAKKIGEELSDKIQSTLKTDNLKLYTFFPDEKNNKEKDMDDNVVLEKRI